MNTSRLDTTRGSFSSVVSIQFKHFPVLCFWTRERFPMATNVVPVFVLAVLVVIRFSKY